MQHLIVPYCERINAGAEFVNTLSNMAFAFVAVVCIVQLRRSGIKRNNRDFMPLATLAILLVIIACGSALFHAEPHSLTQLLDVLPIGLFIGITMAFLLFRHWRLGAISVAAYLTLWLLLTLIGASQVQWLYGTLLYLPSIIALVIMAIVGSGLRPQLISVALCFAAALTIRTLDTPLCETLETGTHWIWHLLAALSAWLAFRACLQSSFSNGELSGTQGKGTA